MQQNTPWQADSHSGGQEITGLWYTEFITVFTRAHNWNLFWFRWIRHKYSSYFSNHHFNIIFQSKSGSPKWYLLFRFSDKNSVAMQFSSVSCVVRAPAISPSLRRSPHMASEHHSRVVTTPESYLRCSGFKSRGYPEFLNGFPRSIAP